MFEILFLGTSAAAPSVHRGLTANVVLAGEHRFLIDCGEGTQRQILKSGIGFKRLTKIFITHAHLDHLLGLGGLISTFVRWEGGIEQIEIWGGKTALERIEALIFGVVFRKEQIAIPIHLIDLKPEPFITTDKFSVTAVPVQHRGGGCFGFVFEERPHRPFQAEKAEALGIPAGPERGKLVRGEAVTLADGRHITPDMVLGDAVAGAKLAYIGDTARTDNLLEAVRGADVLVIEATFLEAEAAQARRFGHITARQAAELAAAAGVGTLVLNHVSRRYRERDIVNEARHYFADSYIARDFDHFRLKRGQPAQKVETQREDDDALIGGC